MIDGLRARFPTLGFALYAMDPGGVVTLEIHDAGEVYTFRGATETEAVAEAFPPDIEIPISTPEPAPPEPSVFD